MHNIDTTVGKPLLNTITSGHACTNTHADISLQYTLSTCLFLIRLVIVKLMFYHYNIIIQVFIIIIMNYLLVFVHYLFFFTVTVI